MAWARNTDASKLSARTLRDREACWKELESVFGATHIDGRASEHMLRCTAQTDSLIYEFAPPLEVA